MRLRATGHTVARSATEYEPSRVLASSATAAPGWFALLTCAVKASLGVSRLDDDPAAAAFGLAR